MYFKGALFLNTLRSVVNDDAKWWKTVHDLFQHFKYQNVMTEDVLAFMNERLGMDLTPVFNEYLRRAKLPALELAFNEKEGTVASRWNAEERGFNMPIRAGKAGAYEALHPTTEWRVMKTSLTKDEFEVPTDLYFVDVVKR
jgi:aminopeptidase N